MGEAKRCKRCAACIWILSLFTVIFIFAVIALFAWAICETFLSSFVPRHRTHFKKFDYFRNKVENTGMAMQLPESASDTKYYWGVLWFVTVAGYGTSLSDED